MEALGVRLDVAPFEDGQAGQVFGAPEILGRQAQALERLAVVRDETRGVPEDAPKAPCLAARISSGDPKGKPLWPR